MAEIYSFTEHALDIADSETEILYDGPAGKIIKLNTERAFQRYVDQHDNITQKDMRSSLLRVGETDIELVVLVPSAPEKTGLLRKFSQAMRGEMPKRFESETQYVISRTGTLFALDPSDDYYKITSSRSDRYPQHAQNLVLEANQNDPDLGRFLFAVSGLHLNKFPMKTRDANMCLGAMTHAKKTAAGSGYNVFSQTPIAVRRDPDFCKAVVELFRSSFDSYAGSAYRVRPAEGGNPAELVIGRGPNADLGIPQTYER